MKVFDIVKVVTNGNFDTQVLANDMYKQAFPTATPAAARRWRSSCSCRCCPS